MLAVRLAVLAILAPALGGCGLGFFSTRATNPVVEDSITFAAQSTKIFSVVSMSAGRRMILTSMQWDREADTYITCAEAPPDALEAVAEANRGAISVPTQTPFQAGLDRSFAVSAAPLLSRSQGLQFARDQMSSLCQLRLSRIITNEDVVREMRTIREQAVSLITAEMPALTEAAKRPAVTVVAPTVSTPASPPAAPPAAAGAAAAK